MRSLTILAFVIGAALSPLSQAQPQVKGAVATAPGQAAAAAVVTATATIDAIDPATRTVKLKMANGEMRSFVAGEEVRNFAQLKVGDKVNMKYMESVTLDLKKDGKAVVGRTETSSMARAQPGEKPGGVMQRDITAVVNVVNVDAQKKIVQVKTAKGEVIDLPVQDPEQLKLVKKGDQVQATYTQALAVSVEPATPAKK